MDSDSRKTPVRVAFVTRRTSPQVKAQDDEYVMTCPEGLFRASVAVEVLALVLVRDRAVLGRAARRTGRSDADAQSGQSALVFSGLQELLHYFPPVVAGVLIPDAGRHRA